MPTRFTIQYGDKGTEVAFLQTALNIGSPPPSGIFCVQTRQAVIAFQKANGLVPDGIVGPKTWAAIEATAKPAAAPITATAGTAKATVPAEIATASTGLSFADWLIRVARRDLGKVEKPRNNMGEWIKKFWPSTSYPDGYDDRQPYCAAACCYWLDTAGEELSKAGMLEALTGMTAEQFEKWRCQSAAAFGWMPWGKKAKGVTVLPDTETPRAGDFVVFDFPHIGLVTGVPAKGRVATIEANTGPSGGRDGDGCYAKERPQEVARAFVRLNFK
jgi:peptidoglycan hydrolase-like protein with peptidoglycan-binding domain